MLHSKGTTHHFMSELLNFDLSFVVIVLDCLFLVNVVVSSFLLMYLSCHKFLLLLLYCALHHYVVCVSFVRQYYWESFNHNKWSQWILKKETQQNIQVHNTTNNLKLTWKQNQEQKCQQKNKCRINLLFFRKEVQNNIYLFLRCTGILYEVQAAVQKQQQYDS